jgi:hypothetical protein
MLALLQRKAHLPYPRPPFIASFFSGHIPQVTIMIDLEISTGMTGMYKEYYYKYDMDALTPHCSSKSN